MAATGGGINLYDSATVNLNNVTITGNVADASHTGGIGGGIACNGATVNIKNTIVAGNTDNSGTAPDCSAQTGSALTSQGYNLIGDTTNCLGFGSVTHDITGMDAHLDVLAPNDNTNGPTQTHALLAGSPAIDAGNPGTPGSGGDTCAANDQRGVARVQADDAVCDIGAYEAVPRPTTTTTSTTSTTSTTAAPTTSTSTSSTSSTSTSTSLVPTTSTTAPVTTSSSTTVVRPSTTSTTTQPMCGEIPSVPTFASIDCQIDALLVRLAGEPLLGSFAAKLTHSIQTAKARKLDAESACRASSLKKTRKRLQQATEASTQYVHRLSAVPARKKLDPTVRQSFLDDGTRIQQGLHALHD